MPTLSSLFDTLTTRGVLPTSRAKDMRTSLRYLAQALGAESPEHCPADASLAPEESWGPRLEAGWAAMEQGGKTISASTRRNTRNNLRGIFRHAVEQGLLEAPGQLLLLDQTPRPKIMDVRRQYGESSPYRTTYARPKDARYSLPYAQWPPDCQEGWQTYRAKAPHSMRETTFSHAVVLFETYFGYLAHVAARTPAWENVFDVTLLKEFVRWHGRRVGRHRISNHGRGVVIKAAAIAVAIAHPKARELADYRNGLPPVARMHVDRHHTFTIKELDHVADTLMTEGRKPYLWRGKDRMRSRKDTQSPGLQRASRFQNGLILKLLLRVPIRQRNIREMRWDTHLYQEQGAWRLRFEGDDLKVGARGAQINVYAINLTEHCAEFIPLLEEYRREYRPRFPGATASPFVFLTQVGRPFSANSLGHGLSHAVFRLTGKRFYPHLVRSLFATEYLEDTQNYAGAATMLGDTLKVVMDTYYKINTEQQQAKAAEWRRNKLAH
jgi:hypothetical protein